MTHPGLLVLLAIFGLGYLAAKEKAFWNMRRKSDSVPSPLSKALVQLLAMAGGIYLALLSLATFINLEMPERIIAYGFSFDPLAGAAILLALIQPFMLRFQNFIKKRIL